MSAANALSEAERFDWLRLLRCDNIGPKTFAALLGRYKSAAAALEALPALIASGKTGRPIRMASIEETERELAELERCGAALIGWSEPDYPPLLRRIDSAPPLIAARGNLSSLRRSKVAIVGARNASAAGLAFTEQISRGIARGGHVIVSGLARGVDSRAHQAALETGTIAVFAGGLGKIYPPENAPLLERILGEGAAISEMPFGWEPRGRDFPRRNRIVAGLSRGVVVVEAARRSGSLITARFAADYGREIFAVPGSPLDPRAEGPNDLLEDGATFCRKAEDVLGALARRDAAAEAEDFGFREAPAEGLYEPLWDELDLPEMNLPETDLTRPRAKAPAREIEALEEEVARERGAKAFAALPAAAPAARTRAELLACVTALLGPTPVCVDEIVRAAEAPAREVRTILFELELEGRLERHGGDLVSLI